MFALVLFITAKAKSVLRAKRLGACGSKPRGVDSVCFVFSGRDAGSRGILYAVSRSKHLLDTIMDGASLCVYINTDETVPPVLVPYFCGNKFISNLVA